MRSLNPFTGEFYREALQVSRWTREMFCLMEGRHVHPSTLYPGGVGTVATIQLMTDYMTRLMRYVEFMKKVVPMHDDLFDFFYEALPGYEKVGNRRILLGCWGSFQDPEHCNFEYRDMTDWGRQMYVTPGVVVDGKLVTTDLVTINLGIRILLGSSYYDDWEDQEMFVTHDPLGNPVDRRHPWNQHTNPQAAEAGPRRQVQLGHVARAGSTARTTSPSTPAAARSPGCGRRRWPDLVDIGYVKATGHSVQINLPEDRAQGPGQPRVEDPAVEQHDRAEPGPHLLPGLRRRLRAALRREGAGRDPGRPHEDVGVLRGARRGHRLRVHRGRPRRAQPPHGDPRREDRELPPVPADAVERQPAGQLRHAGARTRTPSRGSRSSRRTTGSTSRASTSCGPSAASTPACRAACTCTWATGRQLEMTHSPTQSVTGE